MTTQHSVYIIHFLFAIDKIAFQIGNALWAKNMFYEYQSTLVILFIDFSHIMKKFKFCSETYFEIDFADPFLL